MQKIEEQNKCNNKNYTNQNDYLEYQIFQKNQPDEEFIMNDCILTNSDVLIITHKQQRQGRQGDWICIKCNNLNFSFRKKCNRCKTQTRYKNEEHIRQTYQYYQIYYQQIHHQHCDDLNNFTNIQQEGCNSPTNSTFSPQLSCQQSFDESFEDFNLPSVSPIIKKIKNFKNTPKTSTSEQNFHQQQEYSEGKEYLQQYCWKNIMVEDNMQVDFPIKDSLDYWDLEIQKIVQKIVL